MLAYNAFAYNTGEAIGEESFLHDINRGRLPSPYAQFSYNYGMKKSTLFLLAMAVILLTACNVDSLPTRVPEPTALAASVNDSRTLFNITPAESTATFAVEETLKGNRVTATGSTSNLAGSLLLNMDDLAATVVGPIDIDATSFRTDDANRDRAINKWLLVSRAYPLMRFTPTAVFNLPPTAAIGDTLTFTIEGDLLITTYTQPVTFTVMATAVSADRIEGTAVSTIQRDDFKLRIPSAPGVADVSQTVTLTFDFTALSE